MDENLWEPLAVSVFNRNLSRKVLYINKFIGHVEHRLQTVTVYQVTNRLKMIMPFPDEKSIQ